MTIAEYFYNPEKLLRLRLSKNPVYPFTEVEPNVYTVSNTPKRHIVACVICAVVLLVTVVVCASTGYVSEFIIIPILILLYFGVQIFTVRGPRTLLVDFNQYLYEVCIQCASKHLLLKLHAFYIIVVMQTFKFTKMFTEFTKINIKFGKVAISMLILF